MEARRYVVTVLVLVNTLVLAAGCKGQAQPGGAEPGAEVGEGQFVEAPANPLHDLYVEADAKLEADDKEGATQLMVAALDDEAYSEYKSELFTVFIRFLIYTEQIDEAKTRFLNIIRTEPELAKPGFDLIYGYYAMQEDKAALQDWVRQLLIQPLTGSMKRTADEWLLVSLLDLDAENELGGKLGAYIEGYTIEQAAPLVRRLNATALQQENFDQVEQILTTAEASSKAGTPDLLAVIISGRILNQAAQRQWDAVEASMPRAIEELADITLQTTLANVNSALRRAGEHERIERLAEKVLRSVDVEKKGARNIAAREWVNAAMALENPGQVPERIGELIAMKLPPRQIYAQISRHFYKLLENEKVVQELLVQADIVAPLLEEESTRNALNALILDGCFVTKNYARALELLEEAIGDRDDDLHAKAIVKVKAHKAEQEGLVDEAVKHYRDFMEIMAKSEEDSPDPVTNVIHTRDMILGRNAKRIGDIYRGAGREEDAAKAFAEARRHYQKTLDNDELNAETRALASQEMEKVPQ